MIDTYLAAREQKTNLVNDQARLTEKIKSIWSDVNKFRAEKEQAIFELEQCEKKFIRDQITVADLEAAREASKNSEEKHSSAQRLHGLAVEELERLDRDLLEAQKKIISSCERFATAEREALATAINQDSKLRSRLLEIYAAQLTSSNWSTPSWPHFLGSIFSQPTVEEDKEAAVKFKQKHGLD